MQVYRNMAEYELTDKKGQTWRWASRTSTMVKNEDDTEISFDEFVNTLMPEGGALTRLVGKRMPVQYLVLAHRKDTTPDDAYPGPYEIILNGTATPPYADPEGVNVGAWMQAREQAELDPDNRLYGIVLMKLRDKAGNVTKTDRVISYVDMEDIYRLEITHWQVFPEC